MQAVRTTTVVAMRIDLPDGYRQPSANSSISSSWNSQSDGIQVAILSTGTVGEGFDPPSGTGIVPLAELDRMNRRPRALAPFDQISQLVCFQNRLIRIRQKENHVG
jgi:hypothetical protein